jgi:CheY-like chemotaxis protein
MTILIVDDDADIRDVLGLALRSEGYRVEAASDGLDALDRTAVCVISGHHAAAEEAKRLGAVDYLRKPIELDHLLTTTQRLSREAPRA